MPTSPGKNGHGNGGDEEGMPAGVDSADHPASQSSPPATGCLFALRNRWALAVQRIQQQLGVRFRPIRKRFNSSARLRFRQRHRRVMIRVPKRAERQIRRLIPALLVLCLLVYVLLGAAAFLFFEHTNHEQTVRKWFFNLIVNRHKFARQISSAIFNGTRNMLIIVDYDSSERIQRDLVHLLSQYERQLSLRMPDQNEWTLENSLTYAWGLLTTIGHGHRAPKTWGGQLFALFYCLLGVPFFVVTLIVVSHRVFEHCRLGFHFIERKIRRPLLANHHFALMALFIALYIGWLFAFAFLLYANAIPESFWRSLYTAVLSSLTIQSADYNALPQKLLCLGCATFSLLLSCIGVLALTGAYRHGREVTDGGTAEERRNSENKLGEGGNSTTNTTPKFQVIVDEAGETKLASSSSPEKDNNRVNGNRGR